MSPNHHTGSKLTRGFSGKYETNIGVTTEMVEQMSPEEIHRRELGSKWLFTGWNTYVALIWTLKGCMLFFFNRVTYVIIRLQLPD
jgi:hypothetical protein